MFTSHQIYEESKELKARLKKAIRAQASYEDMAARKYELVTMLEDMDPQGLNDDFNYNAKYTQAYDEYETARKRVTAIEVVVEDLKEQIELLTRLEDIYTRQEDMAI